MSVIIRGMEMPEHCGYCRFRYDGICHALQKTQYSTKECPLVPVPPHGNLKDADAVERNLLKMQQAQTGSCSHGVRKSRAVLRDAPTIIPASDEGE